ncbi:Bug family tripartite tricarboxylate transporter substrate binding protein [Paracraurococcus ruber]|nr:tripartite tricarboxylate transporter substrate binding protein [Paracraurococcus ruber]
MRPFRRAVLRIPLALLAAPALARAQPAWSPSQPVRVLIPFPAGGTMDPVVRIAQQAVQEDLGQPVVIDYRPGGATVVGTTELQRAAPDGHTLLMVANSFAANITLRPNTPYNALRDFAPLVLATVVPHVLVANPAVARDFPGFLEAGRKPGGGLTYGSYGIGTSNHLGGDQFKGLARLNAIHVPYTGTTQAYPDLTSGRLDFMFANLPDVLQPVAAGQLRALAISAEARAKELPNLPTMAELGFPLVLSDSWFGLICRAEVPAPARARLEAAWRAALLRPDIRGRLEEQAFTVLAKPGEDFGADIRRYARTYAEVIQANGIKVE